MSYPIRLALAVVAAMGSIAGGSAPAPVPAVVDNQASVASLMHEAVPEPVMDRLDVDGQVAARATELTAQASEIAQAAKAAADAKAAVAAKAAADAKAAAVAKAAAASKPTVVVDPGSARDIARQMMLATYGWGDDQFTCFDKIITQESGWNVSATNKSSGAYGIPQALPGTKMASAGADWKTNPATQITWALGYVKQRYGTPCQAWSFKQVHGWY